jgi:TPR repeat protein
MIERGQGLQTDSVTAAKYHQLYLEAANKGVFEAQRYLAGAYLTGNGVPKDVEQAAKWMRLAAEHGDAEEECNFAILLQTGTGVPQNFADAILWYQKAAEQGHLKAQSNLGALYGNGQGTKQDLVTAYKWLSLSYRGGYKDSQQGLDFLKTKMTAKQIEEAQQQADQWTQTHNKH